MPNELYNSANFPLDTRLDLTLLVALRRLQPVVFCFIFSWLLTIDQNRSADVDSRAGAIEMDNRASAHKMISRKILRGARGSTSCCRFSGGNAL